jgi:hypothetical protein
MIRVPRDGIVLVKEEKEERDDARKGRKLRANSQITPVSFTGFKIPLS